MTVKQGIEITLVKKVANVRQSSGQSGEMLTVSFGHTHRKKKGESWVDDGVTAWFQATFWDGVDAAGNTVRVQKGDLVRLKATGLKVAEFTGRDGIAKQSLELRGVTLEALDGVPAEPVANPSQWESAPF